MKKYQTTAVLLGAALLAVVVVQPIRSDDDARELITLPPEIEHKFLANMRDHISALDDILAEIAWGNLEAAADTAEERLGMSSLGLHQASVIGPLLPDPMRQMGKAMHRAASKLVLVVQESELMEPQAALRNFSAGLQEVTTNCVSCHSSYRIR